jgi:hypothetical protein
MLIKLKELTCSVIKLDTNKKVYVDNKVKIEDSPWIIYLNEKNTKPLYDSFYATRKHPQHPNDYWYDISNFDRLVESIRIYGYKNEFCNNPSFQNSFNSSEWPGGKGPIKVSKTKQIGDGHHRCAILYYLYGPDYEIKLLNNRIIQDVPPVI